MITVENLDLILNRTEILKNINLEFEDGKIYGLVGRNGSGKTMLMKCITGLVRSTRGKVTVDGKVIGKDIDFPDSLGVIIEVPGFIPGYSGYRNLKLLAGLRGRIGKEGVKEAISLVGLDPESRLPVRKYSLGMRQRLGLAQALMEQPKILVLDEPMNGLDRSGVESIRELLLSLKNEGRLIILASHSREDIDILCDVIYEMDAGAIVKKKM